MTRYTISIAKWLPPEMQEQKDVFHRCKELQTKIQKLRFDCAEVFEECTAKSISKEHVVAEDILVNRLLSLCDNMEEIVKLYTEVWQKLKLIDTADVILDFKIKMWKENLWKSKTELVYYLKELLNILFKVFVCNTDKMWHLVLRLSLVHNSCLGLSNKYESSANVSIYSNTCPYLLYPIRKISITRLLQLLVQNRGELCAHKLIDCLLHTFETSEGLNRDADESSDDSSLEIYQAIAQHMSPPATAVKKLAAGSKHGVAKPTDKGDLFRTEELIVAEQQNVLDLLNVAVKVAPDMLGRDAIKKVKSGDLKVSTRAQNKVLEYYQEILWGEVGNFLEHIILWWGTSPLAARPPRSSQHLREWINRFVPTADVPQYILSALTTLADALGVYVTSTLWDQRFRLALVAANTTCNPKTGSLFCDVLQDLVTLSNQFEVTSDWIMGAPLNELPLVEQIPVLHRLDHSVHTTRLWAVSETKKIANNWNMAAFFNVTHNDIVNCLSQLNVLRLTDYTLEIEKGGLDVHVEVCAKMRAKLVSEVKENIEKLKETPKECIECLASICRTISLANLQMIFPERSYWRQSGNNEPSIASPYVSKYLNHILYPVLAATNDHAINNMVLKIMCESWLDHIYLNKIKFSRHGSLQLLCDFAFVSKWITDCATITHEMRKTMLKNEVLRRCEGVGKLLLRSPGEHIKMSNDSLNKKSKVAQKSSDNAEANELMPAEMYVPNQQQWLELRAHRSNLLLKPPFCC